MKHSNLSRTLIGGFVGTLVMTVLLYSAPSAGAPNTDIAALLGSLFGHGIPAVLTGLWWAGMMWHFVNGTIVFSLIYSYLVYGWLPGSNWFRGMIWGLVLWIGMELTLMPATGNGIFSDHADQHICADSGQLCPIRHLRTDFGRDRRSADGTYSSCRASCLSLRFVGKPGRLRGPTKALSSRNISRPLLDTALSGTLSRFSKPRLIGVSQTSPQSIK